MKRCLWYLLAFPVAILSFVAVALGTAFALVHAAESGFVLGIVASLPLVLCLGMEGMVARARSRQKQRRQQEDDNEDHNKDDNDNSALHDDDLEMSGNKPGKDREEKGLHLPRPFSDLEGKIDGKNGTAALVTNPKPTTASTTVTSPISAAAPTSGSPHPHNGNLQLEMRDMLGLGSSSSSFSSPLEREATEKGKGHDNKLGPPTTKKQLVKTHSMQAGPSVSTLLTKFETNTKKAQL